MYDDDNDDQRVSTVSVKLLPCLLDVFTRMFKSKELGDRDCKLIQTLDATISIANAGFAPGWHHVSPGSGITTRRHANHDTRLKPTEDFTALRILNLLTQLHSSTLHPAVSTSSGLPQNHQRLTALHPAHLPHTRPPLTR